MIRATAGIVKSGQRRIPLSQLEEQAACAATGFTSMDVGDGGIIAIMLRNDIPFLETVLAANQIGAFNVSINWHETSGEVNYILKDSEATVLVIHSDLLAEIQEGIPEGVRVICVSTPSEICKTYSIPAEKALIPKDYLEWESWRSGFEPRAKVSSSPRGSMVYTSGTTGRCKAVKREPVRPENRQAFAKMRCDWFGHRPGMRTAIIGPLYHSVQLSYAMAAISVGASISVLPKFNPERVLSLIESEKITHLHLVPTMMIWLLQLPARVREKYDLSSLEFVIHGAAPCPPEVKQRMIDWWGPIIYEYYGTSEAGMVSRSNSEEWQLREGTVGKPWPGRTVTIYDEHGNVLPPNSVGEIYMSLGLVPNFTYHHAEDARRQIERDGLVTNGDLGYLDEAGYLYLCDRKHNVVISGGVNIYPAEIEAVMATHPAVIDCAVFGIPDQEFGETLAAAVQLRRGHEVGSEDLIAFVRARLARFKVPRRLEIWDSLPRDESGKLRKRVLRAAYQDEC